MRILMYIDGENACAYYRAMIPGRWLSKVGGHHVVATMRLKDEYIREADIIVFQKRFYQEDWVWLEKCRHIGKRTVLEFDDDYLSIPSWNGTARAFQAVKHLFLRMLPAVTKVTVSTPFLAEQYRTYAPNIVVLPNSIDLESLAEDNKAAKFPKPVVLNHEGLVNFKSVEGFKVGWAGSATHQKDLEQVQDLLIDLCRRLPNLVVVMMGAATQKMLTFIPRRQLYLIQGVPVREYLWTLGQLGLHVGLAPIAREKFNLSKSNLKLLEYFAIGAVPVVSNYGEYRRTLINSEAGFLCNSRQDWELALLRLYSNPQLVERARMVGQRLLEEYSIAKTWPEWDRAYRD